ncbi:MAG TPA: CsgE family curli-type amyloid fiber assembly protein [Rubricoccaceae bacterium]|nr:CsgE family curli-type amyloid fiber assembly protein [Rubricoccaceae bacterium]
MRVFLPIPALAFPFLLAAALAASLGGGVAAAQPATASSSDLQMGYQAQVRERAQLVPIPAPPTVPDSTTEGVSRREIDGLVVDETITRLGRDFYDVFFRVWAAPQGATNFTVTVQEQPLPNIGTLVTVRANDEITFQTRLQPRADVIEAAAQQAAFLTARSLERRPGGPTGL